MVEWLRCWIWLKRWIWTAKERFRTVFAGRKGNVVNFVLRWLNFCRFVWSWFGGHRTGNYMQLWISTRSYENWSATSLEMTRTSVLRFWYKTYTQYFTNTLQQQIYGIEDFRTRKHTGPKF